MRVDDGVAATISKTLQPDAVLCYRLETTPGQKISLKVVRGDNTIFSVEGLTDAQDKFTFTAQASSYALTVAQLMRTVRSQAFQIEVTASKQDAGAAPSSSGPAPQMRYQDLPENIRRPVDDVRTQCREFGPNAVPKDEMAGIVPVYLEGKRAVVLDFRTVCTDLYTGANCTNHGCDMRVWVEQDAVWRETFNELLVAPTLSGGADATLFEITGNLWAGDPRCGKSRRERPMARESCAVEFSYRKGVWTSRRKTADRLPR